MKRGLLVIAFALAFGSPATAGGPSMLVGASEDAVKQPDLVAAKAQMTLAQLAGFDSVRTTAIWDPGQTKLSATEAAAFRNVAAAARLSGIRVIVSIYHFGSRTTPLTDEARADFARFAASIARSYPSFREFIIGNEPNLNRFWMPQFGPSGENVSAPAYVALLARTYDALKEVSPRVVVIGGAVSPRGVDRPGTGRDTHSPTAFIRGMGVAYRASGRTKPLMDEFAFHPYGDNSSQAPRDSAHPRTTSIGLADYEKLVSLLREAFDGTAQRGSTLPILYDEFGVESEIPERKGKLYAGTEPATTKPVSETTQADYYRQAIEMAFCQPNVRGIMLFHVVDERARLSWQSGVYYADNTAKASLPAVRAAARASRRGIVAQCAGLKLSVRGKVTTMPSRNDRIRARVECNIDCVFAVRLERLPKRSLANLVRGNAVGGQPLTVTFPEKRLAGGRYRLKAVFLAELNRGPRTNALSAPIEVASPPMRQEP